MDKIVLRLADFANSLNTVSVYCKRKTENLVNLKTIATVLNDYQRISQFVKGSIFMSIL